MIYQFTINLVLISVLFVVLFLLGTDFSTLFYLDNLFILTISSLLFFIGAISFYYGLIRGNASSAAVILSSRIVFVLPFSVLIFFEVYDYFIYIWIFIVLLGVILVTWERNLSLMNLMSFRSGGSLYFIATNVFWGIGNSIIRYLNNEVHIIGILLVRLVVFTVLIISLYSYLNKKFFIGKKFKFSFNTAMLVFSLVIVLIMADLTIIYSLGENLIITEAIVSLEGIFAFFIILLLSKNTYFNKNLKETLDKRTIIIRVLGIGLATIGTFNIIIGIN